METAQVVPAHVFVQQSSQLLALAHAVRGLFELSGLNARAADVRDIEAQIALTKEAAADNSIEIVDGLRSSSNEPPSADHSQQKQQEPEIRSCSSSPQTHLDGQFFQSLQSLADDVRHIQSTQHSLTSLTDDVRNLQQNVASLRGSTATVEDVIKLKTEVSNLRVASAERTGESVTHPALLNDIHHLQNEARDLRATSGIHESWMQGLSTKISQAHEMLSDVARHNTDCAEASRTRTGAEIADLREKLLTVGRESQEQSQQLRELVASCERDVADQRATAKREAHDAVSGIEKRSLQMLEELRNHTNTKVSQAAERIEEMGQRLTEARAASQRESHELHGILSESTKAWQQKAEEILSNVASRFSALDAMEKTVAQQWKCDLEEMQHNWKGSFGNTLNEVRQEQAHIRADVAKQFDEVVVAFQSQLVSANDTQARHVEVAMQSAKDDAHKHIEEVRAVAQTVAEAGGSAATQRAERLAAEVRAELASAVLNSAHKLDELRKAQEAENDAVREEISQVKTGFENDHLRRTCLEEELHSKRCEKMDSHVREIWEGVKEFATQLDELKADFSNKLKHMRDRNVQGFSELHALVKQNREDMAAEAYKTAEKAQNLNKDLESSHQLLQGELARLQSAFASEALSTSERLLAQKELVEDVKVNVKQELRLDLDSRSGSLVKDIQELRTFVESETSSLDQKLRQNHEASTTKADGVTAALKQARESLETQAEQTHTALRAIDRLACSAKEEAAKARDRSGAAESAVQAALIDWRDNDLRAQQAKLEEASRALSSVATGVFRIGQACGFLPCPAGTTMQEDVDSKGQAPLRFNGSMASEVIRPQDLLTWERDGDSLAQRIERGWVAWATQGAAVVAGRGPITVLGALEGKVGHELVRQLQLTVRETDARVIQRCPISPIDPHSTHVAPRMPAIDFDLRTIAPPQEASYSNEAPGGSGMGAVRSLKTQPVPWGCDGPPVTQLVNDQVTAENKSPMTPKAPKGPPSRAAITTARRHWLDVVET